MRIDPDIAALDLDPIGYKLRLDEHWSLQEIDQGILNYRVFLQAHRQDGGSLVPTKEIDTVWHHHILDTEKYISDCHQLFGRYVHHYPYAGATSDDLAPHSERFNRSLKIYENIKN